MRFFFGIAVVLVALTAHSASAAILSQYTFASGTTTDATGSTTAFATSVDADANSTASIFNGAAGLVGTSGANNITGISTQGSGSTFTRISGTAADAAGAITGDDYFSFNLSPNAGFGLNLTSLTFQTSVTMTSGSPQFIGNYFVRSSVDGFASDIFTLSNQASDGTAITFTNRSIDLSGVAYQNLTSPVQFRFYAYDNSDSTGDAAAVIRLDSVVLNGTTVAIPEPSTMLIVAAGFIGLLYSRKRSA